MRMSLWPFENTFTLTLAFQLQHLSHKQFVRNVETLEALEKCPNRVVENDNRDEKKTDIQSLRLGKQVSCIKNSVLNTSSKASISFFKAKIQSKHGLRHPNYKKILSKEIEGSHRAITHNLPLMPAVSPQKKSTCTR